MTTLPDRTPDEWASAIGGFTIQAGHSPNEVRATLVASVAPTVTRAVVGGVERVTGTAVVLLDPRSDLPLRLDVDEPLAVGADRIVNSLAALDLLGGDAIVVDFGTATTFDCVTGDGRFIGGVIMPGIRTSADQLTQKAAKLPATELTAPAHVIGRRTEDCIKAGVLYGAAEAVDGIVRRIREEWPTGTVPAVVATGGLADVIVPFCRTVDRTSPGLTLLGLRIAARHLGLAW
jgi:type III pantothenate kinase